MKAPLSLGILLVVCVTLAFASGPQEQIIYSFGALPDAGASFAALVADAQGNLYGTTAFGGTGLCGNSFGVTGCGAAFRLSPPSAPGQHWTETVLYSFQVIPDGEGPAAALLLDGKGNLYGVTPIGGTGVGGGNIFCGSGTTITGCGTVFELSPPAQAGGAWTETTLYSFQGTGDGYAPGGNLVMDANGNLYGVTLFDGRGKFSGNGVAFKLSPPSQGGSSWTETVLYEFGRNLNDAVMPTGGLIFDDRGSLYGVSTAGGGTSCPNSGNVGCGTIFQLSPPSTSGGVWHENVLYRFQGGSDGATPNGPLTSDHRGGFYGTNSGQVFGTVFNLIPSVGGGSWTLNTVYTFQGGTDGSFPAAGLADDNQGNLYGTTFSGGNSNACGLGCGTVYRLVRHSGWQKEILHSFSRHSGDGMNPESGLLMLGGKFYGTTFNGGSTMAGSVFELTPPGP